MRAAEMWRSPTSVACCRTWTEMTGRAALAEWPTGTRARRSAHGWPAHTARRLLTETHNERPPHRPPGTNPSTPCCTASRRPTCPFLVLVVGSSSYTKKKCRTVVQCGLWRTRTQPDQAAGTHARRVTHTSERCGVRAAGALGGVVVAFLLYSKRLCLRN